jgi:hypothetical protein
MDGRIRVSQLYELQKVALINVHYYGNRISKTLCVNRAFLTIAALAASGTIASVIRNVPSDYRWISITASVIAALASTVAAVFNFGDTLAKLERMHSAYKLLYHSTENLAKQTIGVESLSNEQEAVMAMLEMQLATLGPLDEINPNEKAMKAATERVERQLPASYFYPQNA